MPASNAFSKILVPLDGSDRSEHALAYAAALSRTDTAVTLLHVDVPDGATPAMVEVAVEAQAGAVPIDDQEQTQALAATADRWKLAIQGTVSTVAVYGDPKTEILKSATESGADVIVAATHGRSAIGRWMFGSVADDLARETTIPMLIVRAADEPIDPGPASITRLLLPFDGSELAATALPLASSLAAMLGVPVHVISAYDPGPIGPISTGMDAAYPMAAYTEMQNELEALARESVASAQAALERAGASVTTAVHLGPAALTIEDEAEAGDLIVMTSRGRSGITRALLGSVAESLIRNAKAPTLLVPVAARRPAAES